MFFSSVNPPRQTFLCGAAIPQSLVPASSISLTAEQAHRIAHSAAAPPKIKAFALILLRRIDFRRHPCECFASQGDLRKSIGRRQLPLHKGAFGAVRYRRVVEDCPLQPGSCLSLWERCREAAERARKAPSVSLRSTAPPKGAPRGAVCLISRSKKRARRRRL